MSSRALLSALFMLAISCCSAFASQDQAKAKSSLSGRITNPSAAGLAVRLKAIEKDPLALYDGYSAHTAANGAFHFEDVEPGRYVLEGEGPSSLPTEYGAERFGESGTPIELSPGQHRAGILFALLPKHVVCGKVTDEAGNPFPKVEVHAFAHPKGYMWLVPGPYTTTDGAGNYRLPDLDPGEYFLQAGMSTWLFRAARLTQIQAESLANAEPVLVGPDESSACRENILMQTRIGYTGFHIRGKIVEDPAVMAKDLVLSLLEVNSTGATRVFREAAEPRPGASFDLWAVPAGRYRLILSEGRFPPNGFARQPAFTIFSSQQIVVADADVSEITVAPAGQASLSGQLKLEDLTPGKACPTAEKAHLRIQKEGDGQFQDLEVSADGKFFFPHVPIGTYSIQLHPFLRGASYIRSILLNGKPIEGRRIEIASAASHSLEVTLSSDAARSAGHIPPEDPFERFQAEGTHPKASVSGNVKNAQPDPPLVKLWALRFNSDHSYEYSTKPQPDGSFRFDNVDPGIYLLLTQGPGYALSEYGASYPGLEGTALTLKAGQRLDRLILNAAQKQPSLCGRVTDEDGKPLPNVSVLASAYPRVIDSFGPVANADNNASVAQSAGSVGVVSIGPPQAATDTSGYFRFFDLKPGDYFLWTDFLVQGGQTWTRHWTYFPSSPNLEGAQPLHVSYSPDVGCPHNIHVQTPKAFHVRGNLPRELAHAQDQFFDIDLVETNAAGVEGLTQTKDTLAPGAAFDFANVTPGHFRLRLRGPYRKPPEDSVIEWSGPSCAFASRFAASREIRVRDGDLNDLTLDLIPPLSTVGQIHFEHIPAEWRAFRVEAQKVTLSPVDEFSTQRGAQFVPTCSQRIQVSADGKFKFDNLTSGTYHIDVELMGVQGDSLYLKSVALNGRPMGGRRITLKPGQPAELAMVVSNDGGEVDVRVQSSSPPAEEYRYDEPCRPKVAVTPKALLIPDTIPPDGSGIVTGWFTTAGQVEIPRVPPGRYFALAGDNFDFHFAQCQLGNSPWSDPKFLQWAKALATPVDVAPGQKIKLSLPSATSQIQDLLAKYLEDVRIADHCASSCTYDGFWNGTESAQIHKP